MACPMGPGSDDESTLVQHSLIPKYCAIDGHAGRDRQNANSTPDIFLCTLGTSRSYTLHGFPRPSHLVLGSDVSCRQN